MYKYNDLYYNVSLEKRAYSIYATNQKYIGSGHTFSDSAHTTDFMMDSPINLSLRANTACHLTDIKIPTHSSTIESGLNNHFLMLEFLSQCIPCECLICFYSYDASDLTVS